MQIILLNKTFKSPVAWGVNEATNVHGFIRVAFHIPSFTFSVAVPNRLDHYRNPFTALLKCFESQIIGSMKYEALKERTRTLKFWHKL